jgi:hypothetical protein
MTQYELRKLHIEELKTASIADAYLEKDLYNLKAYNLRYVGPACLGWAYQKERLNDNEFDFLFKWKSIHNPPYEEMTQKQYGLRELLVDRIYESLKKWKAGKEVLPLKRKAKKEVPTVKEINAKKKTARERFYAEMRAKRRG